MLNKNKIMILCKVVDNFGDIGVVYRLARALTDLRPELELTLVVSNLESFHAMAKEIETKKQIQDFHYKNSVWKILDWNLEVENGKLKSEKPDFQLSSFNCQLILECFQCGRPDWLEDILFAPDFTDTVQIIQIDYLTAEDYADEFHLLKSGTRKSNIKKIFFMPGFTEKTGGLIINEECRMQNADFGTSCLRQAGLSDVPLTLHCSPRFAHSATASPHLQSLARDFSLFFFAYEDDCAVVVKGIADFQEKMRESDKDFSVCVYLASGKSCAPFEVSWKKLGSPFKIEKLPFMQQEEFDEFITRMDFLFVRGEDSLARAALTGLPFVWQAYKQDENYQLVKVKALLERMRPYFGEEVFKDIQDFYQSYNDYENPAKAVPLTKMLLASAKKENTEGFKDFSEKLIQNGNLARHLLDFIDALQA